MVTILSVAFTSLTRMEQERCTSPLMCTAQAPHWAMPQPYLVPVRPTCSRKAQSSGVSPSTFTSRALPFTLSLATFVLLLEKRSRTGAARNVSCCSQLLAVRLWQDRSLRKGVSLASRVHAVVH